MFSPIKKIALLFCLFVTGSSNSQVISLTKKPDLINLTEETTMVLRGDVTEQTYGDARLQEQVEITLLQRKSGESWKGWMRIVTPSTPIGYEGISNLGPAGYCSLGVKVPNAAECEITVRMLPNTVSKWKLTLRETAGKGYEIISPTNLVDQIKEASFIAFELGRNEEKKRQFVLYPNCKSGDAPCIGNLTHIKRRDS